MASTMNDALTALAAISNIINRETETLKTKAVVEDSTQSKPDSIIDAIRMGMIEQNIMVEVNKRFDLIDAKLSVIQPQPVVDLTKVFAALEAIEDRLKKLETVPVAAPAPVQVDPDLITKVKAISASFDAAINKIEAKVNIIEAAISEEDNKVGAEVVEEEAEEEEAEEEEAEEAEEEVAEEEKAEEAEEEKAEEEAEEEEELTEFRYKGKDYYMDAECNVYEADEEGNATQVGVYNEVTRKITFNN